MEQKASPVINGKSTQGYDTASFITIDNKQGWKVLDDVVMGGKSRSGFTVEADANSKYINFKGVTNLDGGGFCSMKS